ncbi:hypothetical protein, partial [Klebsiella pneumoniae]|uniref:hypothetical protein n=1 Tax=Klebsiella pneumoniae TaxID=573 RepID=UPI001B8CD5F7
YAADDSPDYYEDVTVRAPPVSRPDDDRFIPSLLQRDSYNPELGWRDSFPAVLSVTAHVVLSRHIAGSVAPNVLAVQ